MSHRLLVVLLVLLVLRPLCQLCSSSSLHLYVLPIPILLILISDSTMEVEIRKEVDSPATHSGDSPLEHREEEQAGGELSAVSGGNLQCSLRNVHLVAAGTVSR